MEEQFVENKCKMLENTYITLPEAFFSRQSPSKVPSPQLILWNENLAEKMGLDIDFLKVKKGWKF